MPASPTWMDRSVCHTLSYDDGAAFTQTRDATAAARSTAAPPVSVRRNARNGVSIAGVHAVYCVNGRPALSRSPALPSGPGAYPDGRDSG
jgi:hypothetical protein